MCLFQEFLKVFHLSLDSTRLLLVLQKKYQPIGVTVHSHCVESLFNKEQERDKTSTRKTSHRLFIHQENKEVLDYIFNKEQEKDYSSSKKSKQRQNTYRENGTFQLWFFVVSVVSIQQGFRSIIWEQLKDFNFASREPPPRSSLILFFS